MRESLTKMRAENKNIKKISSELTKKLNLTRKTSSSVKRLTLIKKTRKLRDEGWWGMVRDGEHPSPKKTRTENWGMRDGATPYHHHHHRKQKTEVHWGAYIKKSTFSYLDIFYIIGKLISCALRICHCFWALGSFQPAELVHENGPEKWFFWLFSTYMFLESWDQACNESVGIFRIRGHLRPWEVIKGHQRSNLKNNRT